MEGGRERISRKYSSRQFDYPCFITKNLLEILLLELLELPIVDIICESRRELSDVQNQRTSSRHDFF